MAVVSGCPWLGVQVLYCSPVVVIIVLPSVVFTTNLKIRPAGCWVVSRLRKMDPKFILSFQVLYAWFDGGTGNCKRFMFRPIDITWWVESLHPFEFACYVITTNVFPLTSTSSQLHNSSLVPSSGFPGDKSSCMWDSLPRL